jgi:glutamate dehydrogenase
VDLVRAAADAFLSCLPPGYEEETAPTDAARDWLEMSGLAPEGDRLVLSPCREGAPGDFRMRRVGRSRMELSSMLPVLESFGLTTVEAVPWHFAPPGQASAYVDDIGLRVGTAMIGSGFDLDSARLRLVDAVSAVLRGDAENNVLNRLVIGAGLTWREVNLLSAYRAYRDLAGGQRASEGAESMGEALVAFPAAAAAAVRLFSAFLVPTADLGPDEARSRLKAALSEVPDLPHYEALGELVALIEATTRSSWALQRGTIGLKLSSGEVPFLPAPRPAVEVFVWSPWFEGLHLRFGRVARGGIRWSDRPSDMRSEVLGLAKAQVKKNSVIVPTGAKGGFVLQNPASGRHGAESAYSAFIGALLDITDNIVDGKVSAPEGVKCRDSDDPYLVVAPDKGTAAFSDLANAISTQRGFWLGDAFASGGSQGYDHKALGITAGGAWVAVRRHFRALGMDAQTDALRVVGVGDMCGDVFGNGMLQSRAVRLVAAFDHRHIFVDPAPDPGRSYDERLRLSKLERSSWGDYDLAAASEGAAVFSRQAKQVELSPQACSALGVRPGAGTMSPPELVRTVLRAPVDLIFFGGIGTFVKAPGESDAEVDDRSNDDVRVGADELRARVVAEGANLAVTPRARASYSRRGGRVNGDFIDNVGGVAMSDREVNLKILLGLAQASGRLDPAGRDKLLAEATDEVAREVLAAAERSVVALDAAAASSAADLPAYEALMGDLESAGLLNAAVEALPQAEELARRREVGAGLSRPELAILLAYARSELARAIEGSDLIDDPALWECAHRYFPASMRDAFSGLVRSHPLFAQLLSSELANEIIERMGAVWAHEVAAEAGRPLPEVAGAYWTARQVLQAGAWYGHVDELAWSISADAEAGLRATQAAALNRLARWYLASPGPLRAGDAINRDLPLLAGFADQLVAAGELAAELAAAGAPAEAANKAERMALLAATGELAQVARATGQAPGTVLAAHRAVDVGLSISLLQRHLRERSGPDRWDRWQAHLLGDDLAGARAEAATRALTCFPAERGSEAARDWLASRSGPLGRASSLARQFAGSPVPSLSLGALAVRALVGAVLTEAGTGID